ncbi:deoxyguanosinetriphosphate triphosphohydrolase [Pseudoclavibacter sp. 13-3]|uniref:deoxyguanosinetriphosphate triphosphohydrolase n=1 Tax=Pseudoclavibacter sp. 13-3 TaxID=2901228 RepID=UPI001E2EF8C3|nr:deoxyguanosinetriphosphate triphosphohydrolase [Pseudoclavibacter sp. 13-3]MCD7100598.1 deoxyguanosinetriphosphate triphosphohydrolase [Pseudoclavibacter sp. 13-3]
MSVRENDVNEAQEDATTAVTSSGRLKRAKYARADRERWYPETHTNRRGDFERDRGRMIHSSALRRLSAKTGVFSPTAGLDFVRNRLTHSLEVAQVGRELGKSLGLNPNLVDSACLAHDFGHPPFGHNGEMALAEWAVHFGGFEGNAQTLRLLTRLETKRMVDGVSYGLNLTRATLDATAKYPWGVAEGVRRADETGGPLKYGVYADDLPVFEWLRAGAPAGRRCVEAQVMDLSDDIAYSVHDFEDGIVERYVDPEVINDPEHLDEVLRGAMIWTGTRHSADELAAALHRLQQLPLWLWNWSESREHLAQLKDLTSELIGRFCRSVTEATRAAHPVGSLIRYRADVELPVETSAEITLLKGIVGMFIMASDSLQPYYERQRSMLAALLDSLWKTGDAHLEPAFRELWRAAPDDDGRRRVIVDQVAMLTDLSAEHWYARFADG